MHDRPISPAPLRRFRGQTAKALAHLEEIVADGLQHGFFSCSVECEIGSGGRRNLVIRAGKSYKFTIGEDELPR
jgi:hypothetical protein